MKSFNRTIAALVALCLSIAGAVTAQEPVETVNATQQQQRQVILTQDESMEDEMAAAKRQMRAAEKEMNIARKKMGRAEGEQEMRAAEREMERAARKMERAAAIMNEIANRRMARERAIEAYQSQIEERCTALHLDSHARSILGGDVHAGRTLVIPGEQIKTRQLVTIMEDLSVMSRILEKKLGRSKHYSVLGNLNVFSDAKHGAQCIYLDDYGALFLVKVDFPLVPSVDTQEQEETEEPTDRLWEETRQEIFVGPGTIRRRRIRVQPDTEPRYDAEKVEELKRNLIKSLRHAANIRALEPEQWLIVTVIGSAETDIDGILTDSKTGRVTVIRKHGELHETYEGALPDNLGSCSPTVMTIRVKKSDVDAFAAGELDFDGFRERVQIFTY